MSLGSCELGALAIVALGYKSLQNRFFYVNGETVAKFGIEKEFLQAIHRIKDLDASRFLQTGKHSGRVFYCKRDEADLRGTGALKYIRAMAKLPAAAKKQAGKPQSIEDALRAQGGGTWYAPKARLHSTHIWLRKAFGSVYAPYIFASPSALDQRCNLIRPRTGIEWEVLSAVITSTLFALAAESFGAASMGAGALELATTRLRQVPVPDVRNLTKSEGKALVTLVRSVWKNDKPVDWSVQNEPGPLLRQLDGFLLERMSASVSLDRLYNDLRETCRARLRLAEDKQVTAKKVVQQDIAEVAQGIADSVSSLLEGKPFPEAFCQPGASLVRLEFPKTSLAVESEPFITEASVTVRDAASGKAVMSQSYPRYRAQVIVRALLVGRRVFSVPADPDAAALAIDRFLEWFPTVVERIDQQCRSSALGTRFEEQLRDDILRRLKLHPKFGDKELWGKFVVD